MSKCHIVGNHMSRLICHSIRSNKDELYILKIFLKAVHRITKPSSPVRQDGERRTTILDEYAFRRAPFFLILAHLSLCFPLIFNLLMQSSITLVARVAHVIRRPT